jgi:CheY-like chemotaxis protein
MSNRVDVTLERTSPIGMVPASVRPSRFPFVIGRGEGCDVLLFDPALSRRHCHLDWRNGKLVVEDLHSRNGTKVNGRKIIGPQALAEGDQLQLGMSIFAVRLHAVTPACPSRRVLVVEDDADTAGTLAVLLRGWGHDVEIAGDGAQALESARARPPDAVLLDLHPGDGPDGLEIARRLRDEAGLRDAKVVALTGHPPEGAGVNKRVGDLDGILVKPVDARALRAALAAPN